MPISLLATHGLYTYALPWLKQLAAERRWPWREGALRLAEIRADVEATLGRIIEDVTGGRLSAGFAAH